MLVGTEDYIANSTAHKLFQLPLPTIFLGLGLPHTDENPYNRNLGNCLDYTDDPEDNVLPGEVNFDKLANMYLTRRLRRVEKDGTVVERTELIRR